MDSYEIYRKVKEIGDERIELSAEGSKIVIEKMQDQYEMFLMGGVLEMVFTEMDCVDAKYIEFYLDGVCVANLDATKVE